MPNDVSGKKLERSANIVIPFEGEKFVGILVDRDRGSGAEEEEWDMFALLSTSSEWQKGAARPSAPKTNHLTYEQRAPDFVPQPRVPNALFISLVSLWLK